MACVVSVNVGRPRTVEWLGRLVTSAIWKEPVDGPIEVAGVNLAGDDQADRRVHGGPDKAVYAYATEDYAWWSARLGTSELHPATFGENLTTTGIDLNACSIGDRWRVGSALLEVSQPRSPCFKLGMRVGDEGFPGRFEEAGRQGCYLRIVEPGVIARGDSILVEPTMQPAINVGSLAGGEVHIDVLRQVLDDARVPEGWRRTAARVLARIEG